MTGTPICTKLEGEIAALADLPRAELVARWEAVVDGPVPRGLSRRLLILAIAYHMQVRRHGGLTAATRRRLRTVAGDPAAHKGSKPARAPQVVPGTRLIREWNGVSHVVDAIEGGFIWQGARYASLSAVARAITGTRWSGPRFFALTPETAP